MEQINVKAFAKINLGLDVIRKREDGYHDVKMIMQTVYWYDKLRITRTKKSGIAITTNLNFLPVNENNLVYKAAKRLQEHCKIEEGVSVELKKHIPIAAGLAGGSADAAAVLYGMDQLFCLGLGLPKLMELGRTIGADVPYCLLQGTVLAEGMGEKLKILPSMAQCYVLAAKPGIGVSTKFVYEHLKLDQIKHPDIDAQIQAIQKRDIKTVAKLMANVLETVTGAKYPAIGQIKKHMIEHGALNAMMSGSGPTVFGLFKEEETAKNAYFAMRQSGLAKQIYLTNFYNKRRT